LAESNLETGSKIFPLTSVRFLAALYVVIDHGADKVPMLSAGNAYVRQFAGLGYVAVNFFFVLSGYILAVVYLQGKSSVNKRNFWVARIARIYPIYLIVLALDCPHFVHSWIVNHTGAAAQPAIFPTLAMNVMLLQAWWTRFLAINIPGWSLCAEVFFYAAFPFAGALLWRLRLRGVLIWSAVIYLVGNAVVLKLVARHVGFVALRYNPASHLYEFLLGILAAKLHFILQQNSESAARLRRLAPWLLAISVGAYLLVVPLTDRIEVQLLTHGIFSPLFCIAILALASGNRGIDKLFSAAWMVLLGEASYTLYLIHEPIFFILRAPMQEYAGPAFSIYLVLCIGLSVLSYLYIEKPSRRWILRRWGVRSRESEAAAAVAQ
jgi:peptidoglycan/LPS O-acetylase OafA/YrhL